MIEKDGSVLLQAQERSFVKLHLDVHCPCGKKLRARPDQAGTTIHCWACHAPVRVPVPVAPGDWVVRLLRMGARQIFEARTFTLLAIGAVLVTLGLSIHVLVPSLSIPGPVKSPSVWAAWLALATVMGGYGELLRRGSQGDWVARPPVSPPARAWRLALCLLASLLIVIPLVYAAATQRAPRISAGGVLLGAVPILVMPLLMLATYAPVGTIGTRLRMVGAMAARHPLAVLASLLLVPASLLALEGMVFTMARLQGSWSFMIFDLFPKRVGVTTYYGIPYANAVDYRLLPVSMLTGIYADALKHGNWLVGAIPASLALDTSNRYYTGAMHISPQAYLLVRCLFTVAIVTGMLAVLAVQARWLGLLSTMDSRKTQASSGLTGLHALPTLAPKAP